ncbi:MAG: 4-alpha-glucanotransferase [Comamonadaceae bacterium]|nr:4-alpha-glucanotransferase [Comamonadaceae bacterium]
MAEDLGVITPDVEALRDRFGLPGMRILQFAFGGDAGHALPAAQLRSPTPCVYTGTHDNDTFARLVARRPDARARLRRRLPRLRRGTTRTGPRSARCSQSVAAAGGVPAAGRARPRHRAPDEHSRPGRTAGPGASPGIWSDRMRPAAWRGSAPPAAGRRCRGSSLTLPLELSTGRVTVALYRSNSSKGGCRCENF